MASQPHTYSRRHWRSITAAVAAAVTAVTATAALAAPVPPTATAVEFVAESPLASGRWVRIDITESGVYELSHEQLRQMGFDSPEAVAIFGRGGRQLHEQFADKNGNPTYHDGLRQISTLRGDNKIYFYAEGVEHIEPEANPASPLGISFRRVGRNVYTDYGSYLLTDCSEPSYMDAAPAVTGAAPLDGGADYLYHELDAKHNTTRTGQLYWGEPMAEAGRLTWPYNLPDLDTGRQGYMHCTAYIPYESGGRFSFGVEGDRAARAEEIAGAGGRPFQTIKPDSRAVNFDSTSGNIFIDYESDGPVDFANLDYWVLTYPRRTVSLDGSASQTRFYASTLATGQSGALTVRGGTGYVMLDVTDAAHPLTVALQPDGGDATATVTRTGAIPRLVVFDPRRYQRSIVSWEEIANSNLHAEAARGEADMIIITLPGHIEPARRLADFHRKYDGMEVMVATNREVFNEYSQGVPDAMAYRALAKMAYTSGGGRLRNILLAGPLYCTYRSLNAAHTPDTSLLAVQSAEYSTDEGAPFVSDFYGIMDDYAGSSDTRPVTAQTERCRIDLGVGVLPSTSAGEMHRYIDKLEEFVGDGEMAYRLNSMITVGGIGDKDQHAGMALDAASAYSEAIGRSLIRHPVMTDTYPGRGHLRHFDAYLNRGALLALYFGHGYTNQLDNGSGFMRSADVIGLANRKLPFMAFAGCTMSNSDRRERGIGESLVLSTRNGLIGSIVALRDTWSNQNYDFITSLFRNFAAVPGDDKGRKPLTVGEYVAQTKSRMPEVNDLSYVLICDPALRLPLPTLKVVADGLAATASPGGEITVTGGIADRDGEAVTDFDGEAVVRLMEADSAIKMEHYHSGYRAKPMYINYNGNTLTMAAAEVRNGRFSLRLRIPDNESAAPGSKLSLAIAAYDPANRRGASARPYIDITDRDGDSGLPDNTAPTVDEFRFDPDTKCLSITVSDETAIQFYGDTPLIPLSVSVDGGEVSGAADCMPSVGSTTGSWHRDIPLPNLGYGHHTASLTVSDEAGNETRAGISFDYLPPHGGATLTLLNRPAMESARFKATDTGGDTPSGWRLVVIDSANETVAIANGNEKGDIVWNLLGSDGSRVRPGLYRAYVTAISLGGRNLHSQTVEVPVL